MSFKHGRVYAKGPERPASAKTKEMVNEGAKELERPAVDGVRMITRPKKFMGLPSLTAACCPENKKAGIAALGRITKLCQGQKVGKLLVGER